jgi:SPP1 gp7 family putative phage head morphogenesis protein
MYKYLDTQLEKLKKKLRTEFNRLGMLGFDEMNVTNTRRTTKEMFDRLLAENEKAYRKVTDDTYRKAKKTAADAGHTDGDQEGAAGVGGEWLMGVLLAYNFVTGYLYDREAERKRLRLNEQILTSREFGDRQMYNEALRKTANLWWTQTTQYGITVVDEAMLQAYRDMGVKEVRWKSVIDGRECKVCRERHEKIYKISEVPKKTHYNCRCYLEPVKTEE